MAEGGIGEQDFASNQIDRSYNGLSPAEAYKYTLNPGAYQPSRETNKMIYELRPYKRPTDDSSVVEFKPAQQDNSESIQPNTIINDFRSAPA